MTFTALSAAGNREDKWRYRGEPMRISIDFDGTCVESTWPNGPLETRPGCVEAINKLLALGHSLTIWTCREPGQEAKYGPHAGGEAVWRWLEANGWNGKIGYNENTTGWIQDLGDTRKIFAHVYIDDRNLGGFPGWDRVLGMLGIEG